MSNVVVLRRAMERVEVDSSCVTVEILQRTFRVSSVVLSLVHNMTLVRASRRERREHRERQFVNYPASVSVGERWLTLE